MPILFMAKTVFEQFADDMKDKDIDKKKTKDQLGQSCNISLMPITLSVLLGLQKCTR